MPPPRRFLLAGAVAVLGLAVPARAGLSDYLKRAKEALKSSSADKKAARPSREAVAAARGLGEDEAAPSAGDAAKRNFRAIDRLDGVVISEAELRRFVKEGKLDKKR